jgi:tetratricopeptide (TPR) repeat protein
MNFIFRTYPSHPWLTDWTFEPRGCNSSMRENSPGLFFRAGETVGRISPSIDNPEWVLQVPIPQNSRINILFNGFCAYFSRKKDNRGAEVLVPEPGVLWGRTVGIPGVTLAAGLPIETADGVQWLDCDTTPALLAIQGDTFCLVTKMRLKKDAIRTAEGYLARDFEELIAQELDARDGAKKLFEDMAHHDALAVISAESMMKALRPAEGNIPLPWSQSSTHAVAGLDVNELIPLVHAWRLIDTTIAEQLISCALKLQNNAGAIPVFFSPHTTYSLIEAPKPLLAKAIEAVWQTSQNDGFLTTVLPLARRHLQWLLHHFDPKRKGIHCWKSKEECMAPGLYESDLATVDLTVLLLTEIDALNRLRGQSTRYRSDADYFHQERGQLVHNLGNMFWNEANSAFDKAFLRDNERMLQGFPAFLPLLWDQLEADRKNMILDRVHESGLLPGGLSVLSWRKSAMDDDSFPILQQLLTFHALQTSDPNGTLLFDFSRITLQGFVEWHSLSLEKDHRLSINPAMAAFIMNVQAIRQYRYHAKGGFTGSMFKLMRKLKADRFDLVAVAATVFTLVSVHTMYNLLKTPPPMEMLEAEMNSAYANKDALLTIEWCKKIIQYYPEDASEARLLAGNILLLQNHFKQATSFFRQIRKDYPDSPGPMIAMGLCLQQQGAFEEAEENYYEFCYIFEEIFPTLVGEINAFRQLMQEGFRSPPKWQKIYGYQLMHELE